MAGEKGQQQGGGDNSLAPLWISIAIFIMVGIIWIYGQYYIVGAVFAIRKAEATLVSLFLPAVWSDALVQAQQFMQQKPPSRYLTVGFGDLAWVSELIGDYLRYPILLIVGGLAVVLYVKNPMLRFCKSYDMNRLVQEEKTNWPQITPVSKLNLLDEHIDEGMWAMAQAPMNFAKKHQLLVEDPRPEENDFMRNKKLRTASINREETRRVFAMQLGAYWTRVEDLPIHSQTLFAIFAARIGQDREAAQNMLKQLAISTGTGQLNFTGVQQLLNKYKDHKRVKKVIEQHAFVLTVMASMLQTAREDGVLACADFLWLKPLDRPLWFMLECVGRQTAFTEIAGPYGHWLTEKSFGSRLNIPMVEEAVNGLEIAIKEFIYKPDDED